MAQTVLPPLRLVVTALCFVASTLGSGSFGVIEEAQRAPEERTTVPDSPTTPRRPSAADEKALRSVAESVRAGLILLGISERCQATGFVLSKKHRLVATAAHVADIFAKGGAMVAVPDGARASIRLQRVYYHPGTIRELDKGLRARSLDPVDGPVDIHGPDIAVVSLSADGPELVSECTLANNNEIRLLQHRAVGLLAYPVSSGVFSLKKSFFPTPNSRSCFVRAMTDSTDREDAPVEQRRWVWVDTDLEAGSSGCPLFLPNGHIVAIGCRGSVFAPDDGPVEDGAYRIDSLPELLFYHSLRVSSYVSRDPRKIPSEWGPDPSLQRYREAVRILRDTDALLENEQYADVIRRCNQALRLAPTYGRALLQRSKAYQRDLIAHWQTLDESERVRLSESAFRDSYRCLDAYPELNPAHVIHIRNVIQLSRIRSDPKGFRECIRKIDSLMDRGWPNGPLSVQERSFAFDCRAQCHQFLGELEEAEKDYDEAIRSEPTKPSWYLKRAQFMDFRGRPKLAERDREKARTLSRERVPRPSQ